MPSFVNLAFFFTMYLYDLEETFLLKGFKGVDIGMFKLFLLLNADDIVIISETGLELQSGLNILKDYCEKWRLAVIPTKTKVMIFRGELIDQNLKI